MKSLRFALLLALLAASLRSLSAADQSAAFASGKFGWADLVTTDPKAAIDFYTGTFGWTAREIQRHGQSYTFLLNHGQPVAGVAYRKADAGSKAIAGARWVGSISVPDIQAATAAVTAAGGRVLVAPRKIEGRGWQAVVTDPEGAVFGLIVREQGGESANRVTENNWAWVQLLSGQPAAAVTFYRQALGYQIEEDTRSARRDDYLLSRDGVTCAGLTPLPEKAAGPPGWLGYIQVADVAATLKAAAARGGRVLVPLQDVPGALQVAIITDPLGGAIGLVGRPAPANKEGAP